MRFLSAILVCLSAVSVTLVQGSALPNPGVAALDIVGRDAGQLYARAGDFADPKDFSAKKAGAFIGDIPENTITPKTGTLYSEDSKGTPWKKGQQQSTGFRLDYQGNTGNHHNYQVQINGAKGKTTVAGALVGYSKQFPAGQYTAAQIKAAFSESLVEARLVSLELK